MSLYDLDDADTLAYDWVFDTAREMMAYDEPLWQRIGALLLAVINDYEQRLPRDRRREAFDAANRVVLEYGTWLTAHGFNDRDN